LVGIARKLHKRMVGAAGIEPATLGLEIRCSIRLSYAPSVVIPLILHGGGILMFTSDVARRICPA
jgi:hypothetical protein